MTSPKSERSARAWGSPISSSSLFTARQPRIAGRKPHNIESLGDRKKSYKELSTASRQVVVILPIAADGNLIGVLSDCVWGTAIKVLLLLLHVNSQATTLPWESCLSRIILVSSATPLLLAAKRVFQRWQRSVATDSDSVFGPTTTSLRGSRRARGLPNSARAGGGGCYVSNK